MKTEKPPVAVRVGYLRPTEWPRATVAARLREARKDGVKKMTVEGARVYQPVCRFNPYVFFVLTGPKVQNAPRVR